jgi:hypothetical protein
MTSFTGQFEYLDAQGTRAGEGPCRVTVDAEAISVAPVQGSALVFDLGDIDSLASADYQLTVRVYTGATVLLRALGKAFQTIDRDLREARRDRFVACLLLADLEECARCEGAVEWSSAESAYSGPAEIRVYETNIAVLPDTAAGIQWRLAEVDGVRFDSARYAVEIRAGRDQLTLSKLGRRTDEIRQRLEESMAGVVARSGKALLSMLPFLSPDQLSRVIAIMREGRTAALADLAGVDSRIGKALLDRTLGVSHRPFVEALLQRAVPGSVRIGFKLLDRDRPLEDEAGDKDEAEGGGAAPDAEGADLGANSQESETPVVFWLFVPLAGTAAGGGHGLVAWEPTTGAGRATYLFRLGAASGWPANPDPLAAPSVDAEIERLNGGLLSLNFRREPIYQSDDALARTPAYRRYVIANRRLPELRRLRAAFAGRAIHSSLDRWQAELDAIASGS